MIDLLTVCAVLALAVLAYRIGYGVGECDALADLDRRRLP